MEQSIRKMNVGKFRFKKVRVMIVTDLAARGIDFPLLENVINFNIPTNPKMFIHRVGRVARIENSGSSWNIVNPFERAYMCDIFRFLNIPLIMKKKEKNGYIVTKSRFGYIPRSILQPNLDSVDKLHNRIDIKTQWNISINGEKMYRKCSNDASKLGIKQSKELDFDVIHPLFVSYYGEEEKKNDIIINEIKNFKSHNTIFKLNEKEINYWKILKNIQRRKHKNPKAKTLQFVKIKEELTLIKKKKRNFRDNKFFIFCKKVERNIKEKQIIANSNCVSISERLKFKRNLKWDLNKKKFISYSLTDNITLKYTKKQNLLKNKITRSKLEKYQYWRKHDEKKTIKKEKIFRNNNQRDLKSLGLKKFRHN